MCVRSRETLEKRYRGGPDQEIDVLEKQMRHAAKALELEGAAQIRNCPEWPRSSAFALK